MALVIGMVGTAIATWVYVTPGDQLGWAFLGGWLMGESLAFTFLRKR